MLQKFDERNRDLIVGVNGRLVHRDQAAISPFDSAVQGGDAVWEGLRLYQGKIFRLAHMGYFDELDIVTMVGAVEQALNDVGAKVKNGAGVAAAQAALTQPT